MSNSKSDAPPEYTGPLNANASNAPQPQYGAIHPDNNQAPHVILVTSGNDQQGLQDNPPHSFDIAWGCFLFGFIVPIAWIPGFFYGIRSIHRSARIFGILNLLMIVIFLTFAGYTLLLAHH